MSTTNVTYEYDTSLKTTLSGADIYSATLGTTMVSGPTNTGALATSIANGIVWNGTISTSGGGTPYPFTNQTTGWNTYQQSQPGLKVSGNAEFEGEVTIRGVKLDERLNVIEERLGILRPNNDLEGKWEKLKALGEEYRKLEQEILEGEDIWATLKK